MDRQIWENQFKHLLQKKLQLTPEQVRFPLSTCFSLRQTPAQAIAYLEKLNKLCPEMGVFPSEQLVS
jgi:hypothetical protein